MQKGFAFIPVLVGVVIIAVVSGAFYYQSKKDSLAPIPSPKACTMEAKLCPDGLSVGRVGPNCEFALCPKISPNPTPNNSTDNGKIYRTLNVDVKEEQISDPRLVPTDIKVQIEKGRIIVSPHLVGTIGGYVIKVTASLADHTIEITEDEVYGGKSGISQKADLFKISETIDTSDLVAAEYTLIIRRKSWGGGSDKIPKQTTQTIYQETLKIN